MPTTDADMLEAGSSFLDAIEKSLGLGYVYDVVICVEVLDVDIVCFTFLTYLL